MIKVKDLVPSIYYDNSRDFQFLGRSFEVVYNYVKTNVDLMTDLPLSSNSDLSMINLLLTTLGFEKRHEYNAVDLKKICSVFSELVKLKGTKKAVELAVSTLLNSQNIDSDFEVIDVYDENKNKLYMYNIYIPIELDDRILLEDLFEYILPVGYTYNFIYTSLTDTKSSNFEIESKIKHGTFVIDNLSLTARPSTESGDIYARDTKVSFENITSNTDLGLTYTGRVYKPETTGE